MPQPKLATFPAIRGALRFYQIASVITGVMLLLLCTEMIIKYALGYELFAGGSGGLPYCLRPGHQAKPGAHVRVSAQEPPQIAGERPRARVQRGPARQDPIELLRSPATLAELQDEGG